MYESFYRLSHRPFAAAPSAEGYVPTPLQEEAIQKLTRAVERAEGPGLLVGPPGTGKSLLLAVIGKHFQERLHVAHLASARLCTRRALLQNILFELKLPYRQMDEGELRLSLVDHLEPGEGSGEGLLLLVDEAHTLPLRLLEEVRLITNLVRDGQPRVRLILAGSMALEERLASPKLESFHQRIAARCYLQPLMRDETIRYVEEKLRRAGAQPGEIFTAEALRAIHTATDGIPRLVNQLCDHALLLGSLGGHKQLDTPGIEEAWADLQQLPAPWQEPARAASVPAAGVIEFGQLAEDSLPQLVGEEISVSASAEARLDTIESGLDALREECEVGGVAELPREGEVEDFAPVDEGSTEVELIFHQAHDPFGSGWEDEEVVIDRYAALDHARLPHVRSSEGRSLGAAIAAVLPPDSPQPTKPPTSGALVSNRPELAVVAAAESPFDPASDPLLPEDAPSVAEAAPKRMKFSLRDAAADDRDLLVIDEEEHRPPRQAPLAGRVRRQEYRQLFSNLRKRG
jgi:type II secretory pathway predicted ATPase ExeA